MADNDDDKQQQQTWFQRQPKWAQALVIAGPVVGTLGLAALIIFLVVRSRQRRSGGGSGSGSGSSPRLDSDYARRYGGVDRQGWEHKPWNAYA